MVQAGRGGYQRLSAKGRWSGQAATGKRAGEHVRMQCTEGCSLRESSTPEEWLLSQSNERTQGQQRLGAEAAGGIMSHSLH